MYIRSFNRGFQMTISNNQGDEDILKLIQKLGGRIKGSLEVVDGVSQNRTKIVDFDFDGRDTVEVSFHDVEVEGSEPNTWAFNFTGSNDGEGEMGREERRMRREFLEETSERLSEALREATITAEEYYEDHSIKFDDLPVSEKLKVITDDYEHLLESFERVANPGRGSFRKIKSFLMPS